MYEKQRKGKLHQLEHHMEELYSGSWWNSCHARAALSYIPDLLKLCAFLLQYADRAQQTTDQRAMLLRDEETYYAYLVKLIREL